MKYRREGFPAPYAPLLRVWGWPLALALLTASGLGSALLSDGWGNTWSWFALGAPVAAMARLGLRRSGSCT